MAGIVHRETVRVRSLAGIARVRRSTIDRKATDRDRVLATRRRNEFRARATDHDLRSTTDRVAGIVRDRKATDRRLVAIVRKAVAESDHVLVVATDRKATARARRSVVVTARARKVAVVVADDLTVRLRADRSTAGKAIAAVETARARLLAMTDRRTDRRTVRHARALTRRARKTAVAVATDRNMVGIVRDRPLAATVPDRRSAVVAVGVRRRVGRDRIIRTGEVGTRRADRLTAAAGRAGEPARPTDRYRNRGISNTRV